MRNPNGYGTVKKLSGKRRNPFAVYITTEWAFEDGVGRQKQKPIGYYPTRQDAMIALAEYNKMPFDINSRNTTFEQIYDELKRTKFDKMARSARFAYITAFKRCDSIKSMKMADIRKMHMQKIVDDNKELSKSTLANLLKLFHAIFRFAMENDIVEKDYSKFVTAASEAKTKEKKPFTLEETNTLWNNLDIAGADVALILIYTGLRLSELFNLKREDIHLDERWIDVKGTKTKAAKRIVPIHKKIVPLFKHRIDTATSDGLFGKSPVSFRNNVFSPLCERLGFQHTPHECRHTFISRANASRVNPILLKKIVGHSARDLTQDVYTHAYIEDLIKEIDQIEF